MMLKFKFIIQLLITRFHLLWVVFYLLLIGGTVALGENLYERHSQDVLPEGNIELLVSKTKYQVGETVEFTVVNHFPTTIYVTNQCPGEPLNVYRWENKKWTQVHDTDKDGVCSDQERNVGIMPEGSRGYNFKDWPNLFKEPGVYRIAMVVQHSDDVFFQDFTVLEPVEVIEIKNGKTVSKPTPEIVPNVPALIEEPTPTYEDEEEYEDEEDD